MDGMPPERGNCSADSPCMRQRGHVSVLKRQIGGAMLISKIEFHDLKYQPERDAHRAVIVLTTDMGCLSLVCHAQCPQDHPINDTALELMRDAVRQVRQMPEYRRNPRGVQIAEDAPLEFPQSA